MKNVICSKGTIVLLWSLLPVHVKLLESPFFHPPSFKPLEL